MGETITQGISSAPADNPSLQDTARQMEQDNTLPSNRDAIKDGATEDRPPWLPEKFKSVEDMAKSYQALEKRLGQNNRQDEDTDDSDADQDASVEDQARAITKKAGLDFDDMASRYWDEGGLRDTDYKALEKQGIPKHMVDQFIAGQQALVSARENDAYAIVGGQDAYSEMADWAAENLEPAELKAYNRAVASDDFNTIKVAVKGLKAQWQAAVGYEPTKSVKGQRASASSGGAYQSWAQVEKDMNDPRYHTDPAYRSQVEQKMARSPNL